MVNYVVCTLLENDLIFLVEPGSPTLSQSSDLSSDSRRETSDTLLNVHTEEHHKLLSMDTEDNDVVREEFYYHQVTLYTEMVYILKAFNMFHRSEHFINNNTER